VQSASTGMPAEAGRRTNGGIEIGRTGWCRSGGGQDRAVAHCRFVRWVEERWGISYSETGMLRVLWSLICLLERPDRATRRAVRRPASL
jgi:hypothetical protein